MEETAKPSEELRKNKSSACNRGKRISREPSFAMAGTMQKYIFAKMLSKCLYMTEAIGDHCLDFIKEEFGIDNTRLAIWIKWQNDCNYLLEDIESKLEQAIRIDPDKYLLPLRKVFVDLEPFSVHCNMWMDIGNGVQIIDEIRKHLLNEGKLCLDLPSNLME